MKSNYYSVVYDKANGTTGTMVVKATNEINAVGNAKANCFTGRNFRDAKQVEKQTTFAQNHPNGRCGKTSRMN